RRLSASQCGSLSARSAGAGLRVCVFFFPAEAGIRVFHVTGVQTCALPIWRRPAPRGSAYAPSTYASMPPAGPPWWKASNTSAPTPSWCAASAATAAWPCAWRATCAPRPATPWACPGSPATSTSSPPTRRSSPPPDAPAPAPSRKTIMRRTALKALAAGLTGAFLALPLYAQTKPVEVEFYYPVAVGGPITKIVDDMVAAFEKENPGIDIKPIYAGSYQDSIAKALTALKGGNPPQLAVLLSTDMFTLIDEDAIVPIDQLAASDADKQWLGGFYDAFMQNSRTGGHVWGVPFQRSTIVMYYNKDLFKQAGLDPERAPATWDELVEFGKKLTKKDAAGNVTQWGIEIPSGGAFAYWLFQALTTPNDAILMNEEGNEVYLDKPAVVEA